MQIARIRQWLLLAVGGFATVTAGAQDKGFECLLEPWQVIEMRTPVEGVIASIGAQRGDSVRRGQVLVELQSAAERAGVDWARYRARMEGQINSSKGRIDYATKKLERLTDLQRDNFTSAQSRDEADAERRLAEAELQQALEARELAKLELQRAQEQLALRTVSAPFSGVIVDRMLNVGDLSESGTGRKAVLKLAQIDPMRADVALPAALFGQVKLGARATVQATVGGGRFNGVVRSVDKVIDAASGTFIARVEVPNAQLQAPGGSRCVASIEGLAAPARPRP